MKIFSFYFKWVILFFVVIVITFWLVFLNKPIITHHNLRYTLKPGTTGRQFASDLQKQADLKFPLLFRLLIRICFDEHRLQSGQYLFLVSSTPNQIINQVVYGKVIHYNFTIVNGWNIYHVINALEKAPFIKHTLKRKSTRYIAARMGLKYPTPEGLLLPETYAYIAGTTDLDVLKRAHLAMISYLNKIWPNRSKNVPYKNYYQALTVASLIEKETAHSKEKPIIADVILKRIKKGIRLQIDPTVIYALGKKFNGDLTKKDLQIPSPYNTYVHYGLPPTPIAMPGSTSIDAALHPNKTNYLYFVSKGNGRHVFSETLKQQNRMIARYQLQMHKEKATHLKKHEKGYSK